MLGAEMDPQVSNEVAFQAAAADAVHKAMRDNIVLLEPVMKLEVTVPEEYLGPVTADLNARRAEIENVHQRGKLRVVEALVPLARDVRLLGEGAQPDAGAGRPGDGAALVRAGARRGAAAQAAPGRVRLKAYGFATRWPCARTMQ